MTGLNMRIIGAIGIVGVIGLIMRIIGSIMRRTIWIISSKLDYWNGRLD